MRALTLLQPWASLVAIGAKSVETRSFPTRHRGPLLIHSSKRFLQEHRDLCDTEPFQGALHAVSYINGFSDGTGTFTRIGGWGKTLPRGKLLAVVDLVDCVQIRPHGLIPGYELTPDEFQFGDYTPGRYAWIMLNPRRIEERPAKGALGLWECREYDVP